MPFEKQTQKLLSGGVNLLPPSDIIGPSEAEKCQNWRMDQAGKLVARQGTETLASGLGNWSHTIATNEAGLGWYLGVDTKLHRYNGPSSTTVVLDALTGTDAVFDGDFLGWASFQGRLWIMNKTTRGYIDHDVPTGISTLYPWPPAAPSAAPTVAKTTGNLSGAVKYYVTFDTDDAFESNPTTVGDVITASAEISDTAATFGVDLSSIPVSTNPHVTKRHIYREGGKLPTPYRVRTITDNTTTSITDDGGDVANDENPDPEAHFLTDAQAIDLAYLMEDDHDPAPAAFGLAGPYNGRLIAFNSTAHPERIWYTPATEPWRWPGAASEVEGNWVDVGDRGDVIRAISVKPHMCIIYKQNSIWRLVGDFEDGVIELLSDKNGLEGPRAWVSHGPVDYFRGIDGIYLNTGHALINVSEKISPIFKGFISGVVSPTVPEDPLQRYYQVLGVISDRLYFCFTEAT